MPPAAFIARHLRSRDGRVAGPEREVEGRRKDGTSFPLELGLAVLTLNLAWYGRCCLVNKDDHRQNLEWRNVALQALLLVASVNCAWQSLRIGEPIMLGMPAIGLATVASNLAFMLKRQPAPIDWLKEHIKALVGAGISVYTAFFAFGAVRTIPTLALHPGLWSIPLVVGLALIIYHRLQVERQAKAAVPRPSGS